MRNLSYPFCRNIKNKTVIVHRTPCEGIDPSIFAHVEIKDATAEAVTNVTVANTDAAGKETTSEATLEQIETSSDDTNNLRVGILTMLNMTENEMINYRSASSIAGKILSDEGYLEWNTEHKKDGKKPEWTVTFYDTLDSMLMALNAGDINQMMVYFSTG